MPSAERQQRMSQTIIKATRWKKVSQKPKIQVVCHTYKVWKIFYRIFRTQWNRIYLRSCWQELVSLWNFISYLLYLLHTNNLKPLLSHTPLVVILTFQASQLNALRRTYLCRILSKALPFLNYSGLLYVHFQYVDTNLM